MKLRILNIICEDCGKPFSVRQPRDFALIVRILQLVKCPYCHPDALAGMCAGCRLPLRILRPPRKWGSGKSGFHADLCFSCYQRERREHKAHSVTSTP